eukprot:g19708.t1
MGGSLSRSPPAADAATDVDSSEDDTQTTTATATKTKTAAPAASQKKKSPATEKKSTTKTIVVGFKMTMHNMACISSEEEASVKNIICTTQAADLPTGPTQHRSWWFWETRKVQWFRAGAGRELPATQLQYAEIMEAADRLKLEGVTARVVADGREHDWSLGKALKQLPK